MARAWWEWWVAATVFPALVVQPLLLTWKYGRTLDKIMLGSAVPWRQRMAVKADPRGARSILLFGSVSIAILVAAAAAMGDSTCCTTVGPIQCLDLGLTSSSAFMGMMYVQLRRHAGRQQLKLQSKRDGAWRGEKPIAPDRFGLGFVMNGILVSNTAVSILSTTCKEQVKTAPLYFAPVLLLVCILVRGRPCHLLGIALTKTFVFTPAALFRFELSFRTQLYYVAKNGCGYAAVVVIFAMWARGKYKVAAEREAAKEEASRAASLFKGGGAAKELRVGAGAGVG